MSLPVHLTAKDAERYPEMMKLLTALSQHVNKDGVSVQMEADKQQVNDDHKGGRGKLRRRGREEEGGVGDTEDISSWWNCWHHITTC